MLKIAIVGPESSGKTTLAEALMHHYRGGYVSEVAREYLEELDRPYEEHDLLAIARALQELHAGVADGAREQEALIPSMPGRDRKGIRMPIFYDTDALNIRIWSMEKYGRVHPEIDAMVRDTGYTWRLLCRPDIPWEPDPLRENPHDRDRLFAIWERELQALGLPYTIIEGSEEQRMRAATNIVDVLIQARSIR
ncbi:MAG: ATP-binding protein [Flavobacteriales bacterium]|nr:ATP-binding protein [Flavobacteriales bacterium]